MPSLVNLEEEAQASNPQDLKNGHLEEDISALKPVQSIHESNDLEKDEEKSNSKTGRSHFNRIMICVSVQMVSVPACSWVSLSYHIVKVDSPIHTFLCTLRDALIATGYFTNTSIFVVIAECMVYKV